MEVVQVARLLQKASALALVTVGGIGCTTITLPLCPTIAKSSYSAGESASPVNKRIVEQALARKIEVRQLSWFGAEFRGFAPTLNSFEADYKFMLCAFDPTLQKVFIRETYISCMNHADEWITKIRSGNPAELMLTETKFVENCAAAN